MSQYGTNFASSFNAPCTTFPNWSYDQCYGYFDPSGCYNSCQYVNVIDMEDFMNNEKRKERSRDAARCRRSREMEIFSDLSSVLPLTNEQVSQLDKASIMRLAITYLKVRDMITLLPEVQTDVGNAEHEETDELDITSATETVFLKSIDGFLLVLSPDGDFVYVSENIADYLGITQIDLMGQNIFEYSHPCDHDEIKEMLSIKDKSRYENEDTKSFFLRLKCTLTNKGRSVNLKSATYKVIHCTGHMLHSLEDQHCMVAIGQPIPHPSNIETPLPYQTFFSKHSLDMKFTYADEKMLDFLGYTSEELLGESVYAYHHACDMQVISAAFKSLFAKGQCETNRYRFLAKHGGYAWVLTQATLIYDKVQKPESVVCVNFLISGVECKEEIYTAHQLEADEKKRKLQPLEVTVAEAPTEDALAIDEQPLVITATLFTETKHVSLEEKQVEEEDNDDDKSTFSSSSGGRAETATSKIFAPRTEEMNKGFLMFSDEEPGLTLLKDEPDDLTHLAPVAGDVVSLETHPYLSDMLDDFFLTDAFCPLLTDAPADPFIASSQLLSPGSNPLKSSECSLDSQSLQDDDHMSSTFATFALEDDGELCMKAPYISMAMGDDLPLLNADDLMWSDGVATKNLLWSTDPDRLGGGSSATASIKRNCQTGYNNASKRIKSERKDLLSLISNATHVSRSKNWQLDSGGQAKTTTALGSTSSRGDRQPSESVLMNLLDSVNVSNKQLRHLLKAPALQPAETDGGIQLQKLRTSASISLLDPDALGIPSLFDLTQQDYDVNAPVCSSLLQGEDLIIALNNNNSDPVIGNAVI